MRNYEVTFIIDPVLSTEDLKSTAKVYVDHLKNEGCTIVHAEEMGLKPLAYPIKKRNTGIYHCVEFQSENGAFISKMELALRRDERIMRFLTVSLDKFGVKYNEDRRNGVISGYVKKVVETEADKKPAPRPKHKTTYKPNPRPVEKAAPVVISSEEE